MHRAKKNFITSKTSFRFAIWHCYVLYHVTPAQMKMSSSSTSSSFIDSLNLNFFLQSKTFYYIWILRYQFCWISSSSSSTCASSSSFHFIQFNLIFLHVSYPNTRVFMFTFTFTAAMTIAKLEKKSHLKWTNSIS